jgi:hypothetical protein
MPSDPNAPAPRVEVITSVQRRRRWPTAEKIRLVEETMQPGMSVSYVARRSGVVSLNAHQDKHPMTALIVKAAEICHQKGLKHLIYGKFTYGRNTDSGIA